MLAWRLGLACLLLAGAPALAGPVHSSVLEGPGQAAMLHLPESQQPPALVIILPDAPPQDMRHERYAEHLLAHGIAVLAPMTEATGLPAGLTWMLAAARASEAVDASRIGLLGLGAGAARALEAGALPRALLYPGCGALPAAPDQAPLLLLHGDADPANAPLACAALAQGWEETGAPVTRYMLASAGYAWDFELPGGFRHVLLPAPGQAGRVRASPDAAVTAQAADLVAQFFRELLAVPAGW